MRKSLTFLTVPLVVASSLIYSPANAAPATAWAPTAQHLASDGHEGEDWGTTPHQVFLTYDIPAIGNEFVRSS